MLLTEVFSLNEKQRKFLTRKKKRQKTKKATFAEIVSVLVKIVCSEFLHL